MKEFIYKLFYSKALARKKSSYDPQDVYFKEANGREHYLGHANSGKEADSMYRYFKKNRTISGFGGKQKSAFGF